MVVKGLHRDYQHMSDPIVGLVRHVRVAVDESQCSVSSGGRDDSALARYRMKITALRQSPCIIPTEVVNSGP